MTLASIKLSENAREKRKKINRSLPELANNVIAFNKIRSLKQTKMSQRKTAKFLEIPKSTIQSWKAKENIQNIHNMQNIHPEVAEFLLTPVGKMFTQRLVMSAYETIRYGSGGLRGLQKFLELSQLNSVVASSEGALQAFSVRCEEHIVASGTGEAKQLAEKREKKRKITAGLDELFRGNNPCLVAIDVVSNYILLEKFTKDRKAVTWTGELKPIVEELNIEIDQIVSDLCGALRSVAKIMKAVHIPELFHAQFEISKATSGPLAAQEREFEKALKESEEKLTKAIFKHGENSEQTKKARETRNLREHGYKMRKERRQKVQEAKKKLGKIHHPINLETGKLQTAEAVKNGFNDELTIIEKCADEAGLSNSCKKRLAKARRAFDSIIEYVKIYFMWYALFLKELKLDSEREVFFNEVIHPLSYLRIIWKKISKKEREEHGPLKTRLEMALKNAIYSEEEKTALMLKGLECAEKFQRSSSCVEGRNGMLSLYHHRFHRMSARSCKALTIVHNFHIRRSDGTTAAERFFGCKHFNLFESMVENVKIPGKPQIQHHDLEKRRQGWGKRKIA